MTLTESQKDRIQQKWKYWDSQLKKLWDKKVTSGRSYSRVFFKVQTMDACLRFVDLGVFGDPQWEKINRTLGRDERRKAEKHQKNLVKSAKMIVNNI